MTTTCTTCGGELLTSSGQTFCPACLLQQGMKSSTYGGGPRVAWKPPEIEQLTAAFPQLEIQQLLGVGGMGAVFKVRQKELDRIAALKVLPGEMAADAGFTERFLREARLLASLSHPHIVTVYEFGQRDGIYFLLMEFIDGVTLRQALRAEPIKKLGSKETLAIVGQLCDALQFAHDEGVVHRDIKPENILIDKRGRVKIADFGLARLLGQSPTMPTLTGTHQLMGTPAYMAPEQIEGLPGIDHRADIYSMGVVFYELLTGELPLGRFSPPSERAETDVRLDEVVLRTLAREPDRRYQQASQVKTDVEALRSPAVPLNSLALPAHRRWIGKGVAGFIVGVLATSFVALLLFSFLFWYLQQAVQSNIADAKASAKSQAEAMASLKAARDESARHQAAQVPSHNGEPEPIPIARLGGEGMAGMAGMPGRSGMSGGGEGMDAGMGMMGGMSAAYQGPAIVYISNGPALHEQSFPALTAEQRAAVNAILKETHERYLKEEALHSIVSVDANGVQTTEISAFPEQLRAIENDMWTKLDDAVPVETQEEFRNRLNLYTINGPNDDSDSMGMSGYGGGPGMGMAQGMGSAMGGAGMGMPGGMIGGSPGTGPGLLGWEPEQYPLKIKVSRSGRWFDWSVVSDKSNADIRAVHELDQGKAPTLPSALQRFYRKPGPWMAVANARATYEMKNWMQGSDYFTAESMTREWVVAMADIEGLNENLEVNTADVQKRLSERLEAEALRTPETKEMVRIGSGEEYQSSDFNNTHLRPLMSELAGVSATDVDGPIARMTKAIPLQTLKQHFGSTVLVRSIVTEQGLDGPSDFAALHGEVSSYTETGDTASATITIPNKPPVPIRFKRENGQWKIDAIGSNERLLERLKQTKIWKQHAEIEAVLENARTAYAAKEWQKLADCFTQAGKYRWILRTHSTLAPDVKYLSEEDLKLRRGSLLVEVGRSEILQADAAKPDDQSHPNEEQEKELRILVDYFLSSPENESDALLTKLAESLPESLLDTSFTEWAIQSAILPAEDYRFDFDGCRVTELKVTEDNATASLVRQEGTAPVPLRMLKQGGQWKIDSIGDLKGLRQQARLAQERSHGWSPRDAVAAFRQAMADGRFQTALNCMTEDARNEWLGEMLIGYVSDPNADNSGNTAVRFSIDEVRAIQTATDVNLEFLSNRLKKDPRRSDRTVSPADRRKVAIEAGVPVGDFATRISTNMVLAFLNARFQTRPKMLDTQMLGEFQEIPFDRVGPEAMKYRLQPASPDQQPLGLDIIQIDGLWKLNTVIDPALKPWPLPAEEPAPPAEATPVDGATGVP